MRYGACNRFGAMPSATLRRRTLQRALQIAGSRRALARELHVPMDELAAWLTGNGMPPTGVFLDAVDVVVRALDREELAAGP
jgi:hypothetical protein